MKYCPNCGKANVEDAICCQNCGSLFAQPPASPFEPETPEETETEESTKTEESTEPKLSTSTGEDENPYHMLPPLSPKKPVFKKKKITVIALSCAAVLIFCIVLYAATYECPHKKTITLPAVAATCTTDGLTEGKQCAKCGEVLVEREVIDAAHDYDEKILKEATCTQDGEKLLTCKVCGETEKETINAGHKFVRRDDTFMACSVCNQAKVDPSPNADFQFNTWLHYGSYAYLLVWNCLIREAYPSADIVIVMYHPVCTHCGGCLAMPKIKTLGEERSWLENYKCPECGEITVVQLKLEY